MADNDVIILSDSDSKRSSPSPDLISDFDIEFPAVNFQYVTSENEYGIPDTICRTDSGFNSQSTVEIPEVNKRKVQKTKEKSNAAQQKKQLAEEKRKKLQREKLLKRVEKMNKQSQKPEELIRNCRAMVDEGFQDRSHWLDAIIKTMQENEATYSVRKNQVPYSIVWESTLFLYFLDDDDTISKSKTVTLENWMVVVWDWQVVVDMIAGQSFISSVEDLHLRNPDKKITLLIEGMDKYFSYQNGKKSKKKADVAFQNSQKISRTSLEKELVEIQVLYNCSSELTEDAEHMALTIYQFTKAIALIPSKEEKWQKLEDVETYISGEKKDTVVVSKEGYGLKRLWQKQLCQFNLCSLEVSEAICTVYGSPVKLMEAYQNCSSSEGEILLKDIPVRRAAGPLNCTRKIGPELSKKIYLMFTSEDGNKFLSNA